jgi:hypothetical protein
MNLEQPPTIFRFSAGELDREWRRIVLEFVLE